MAFEEYRNHHIEKLRPEVGVGFTCYHSDGGLPEKLVSPMVAPHSDKLARLRMRLVSSGFGEELDAYVTQTLGLTKGVDFRRHSGGLRGGNRYFDIESDAGIRTLTERANRIGNAPPVQVSLPEADMLDVGEKEPWAKRTARSDKPRER